MPMQSRSPMGRASIGLAMVLLAVGLILVLAVEVPAEVEQVIDVIDLGLILVWTAILILVMQVLVHRPPSRRPRRQTYDEGVDAWTEHDVHRPGYAGQTRRLPTVRDRDGR